MMLNDIQFNITWWLKTCATADAFADHPKNKHLIDGRKCKREDLVLYFNKISGHDNQGVQQEVSEAGLQQSNTGQHSSEGITDSRPAGHTNVQRPKKRRQPNA